MAKALHTLNVLIRPLITEKATRLHGDSKYCFEVQKHANKVQVKDAVEKGFDVKVSHVNVMIMKGKPKRVRGNRVVTSPTWKKAVVTLKEGYKLELFEGV
jgi:large subunit ribosomal protein L23